MYTIIGYTYHDNKMYWVDNKKRLIPVKFPFKIIEADK